MSDRTIYRYIDTFKNAGFTVTKIWSNTYKLEKMPKGAPEFDKLMYFSEEDSYLINSLLDALVPTNALKKGIKDKLLEEYPLAQKELKRKGNFWILDTDICNYAGACRFYVGLAGEIKVIDSPQFEEYVKEYIQNNF